MNTNPSATTSQPVAAGCLAEARDVIVRRGKKFSLDLKGAITVAPGTVVGLVGENGAGKTTLLSAMAGLLPYHAGQLTILGYDPMDDPVNVRLRLGYMSDEMPMFDVRIDKLLRLVSGYYPTWNEQLVDDLLERFKLDPKQKVRDLSRGEGSKLRLLVAVAHEPVLLLLDEPASGLDVAGRRALLTTILDVVQDDARSVVISSHMLADVQRIADELIVISRGSLVATGPTLVVVHEQESLEEALLRLGAAG